MSHVASERASPHAFLGVSALLFASCAALTIAWCESMSGMGEMPMPGGWTMSMAWMRMPGQTWSGAAVSFLGMWVVMMAAMMLPSLVPMLCRYRQAVGRTDGTRLDPLTAFVGVGYFFVWTVVGMAAFPVGVALAEIEMQQPARARRSDRGRRSHPDRRRPPVHRMEGASPRALPGGRRSRPYARVRRRHRLAPRPTPRSPLHL
jgi:predicted metal-binding membrane protein